MINKQDELVSERGGRKETHQDKQMRRPCGFRERDRGRDRQTDLGF